jgi:hypothetical protein
MTFFSALRQRWQEWRDSRREGIFVEQMQRVWRSEIVRPLSRVDRQPTGRVALPQRPVYLIRRKSA